LTDLQIKDVRELSWAINQVRLTEGQWVLLVDNLQIVDELARRLTGVCSPSKGTILLNGKSPDRSPSTRATCTSVFMSEPGTLGTTVSEALARLAPCFVAQKAESSLMQFGLEHLAHRKFESLSDSERRQVTYAMQMGRKPIELAVYCEPCLDLTGAQFASLQAHMNELAPHTCVVCITASLHDARQLGGPHAQLTRGGWMWVTAGAGKGTVTRVLVEGTGLRPIAAQLALSDEVRDLRLQLDDGESQSLQVYANAADDVMTLIARVARQNHASVTRVSRDESLVLAPSPEYQIDQAQPTEGVISSPSQDCNLVRIAWARQRELLGKALLGWTGALLVLGAPAITAIYAVIRREIDPAGALRDTLTFLITYIVPLGSLLGVRTLGAESALGGSLEPLSRFGANRRILVSTNLALIGLTCAAVAAASACVAVLLTSGMAWAELGVCAWIAALGAATYAAIFLLITQLRLRRTWVQWAYFVADISLGGSVLALSALFPHAHLLNLLGLPWPLDVAQWASFLCLGSLLFLAFGLTLIRTKT
jgi:energy-coupling factor transporter ATP-binding protein EcfA2